MTALASENILALVCGLPEPVRSNRLLFMLKAYVDDSRMGDRSSDVYILAGWLAPVRTWMALSDEWAAVLRMSPRIGYFKFEEAMSLSGEFQGISPDSRDEKMALLMSVLADHLPEGITSVIPRYIFEGLFGRNVPGLLRNPYFLSVYCIVRRIAVYCKENSVDDVVELAFDYQPSGKMGQVQEAWEAFHQMGPHDETRFFPKHPPSFLDDKCVVALQAADFHAGLAHIIHTARFRNNVVPDYPWLRKAGELNRHTVEVTPEAAEELFEAFYHFRPVRVGYSFSNHWRVTIKPAPIDRQGSDPAKNAHSSLIPPHGVGCRDCSIEETAAPHGKKGTEDSHEVLGHDRQRPGATVDFRWGAPILAPKTTSAAPKAPEQHGASERLECLRSYRTNENEDQDDPCQNKLRPLRLEEFVDWPGFRKWHGPD